MAMKLFISVAVLISLFCAVATAGPIWSLVPSSAPVSSGDALSVDLVITGKAPGAPPSVAAFDFDVTFDPAIVNPAGVVFGSFLGDPGLFEVLTDVTFQPGVVDLAAVSLLTPAELDALQPADFTLATISFNAVASGTASFTFAQAVVDDAFGNKIPEPATAILAGAGLLAFVAARLPARSKRTQ